MFDIIGKRFWYFAISGILILAGLIALFVYGLDPSIEFQSGSEVTVSFANPVDKQAVAQALNELGYNTAVVRKAGADFILALPELDDAAKTSLRAGMVEKLGEFRDGGFEKVSAKAASDMTRNTLLAVLISSFGMLLYISWAFHKMPNPFRWGVCAIVALICDLLIVLGLFALLGGLFGWQVDLMFVAAILTVIGYAVNDTIVVFDRIRENVRNYGDSDFESVVNASLVETMSRTLITGLGTLFVLISLMIIIGEPIQNMVVVLLVGILAGTYGSIGTAASLLVVWKNGEWGRFIGRKPVALAAK